MSGILTQIKYNFIGFFRVPEIVFYTFGLPLILAVLYFVASSALIDGGAIKDIPVGVTSESSGFVNYQDILGNIEILEVTEMTEAEARDLLEAEEIDAYVMSNGNLLVNESNVNTSVVKSIMDEVQQTIALGMNAMNVDFTKNFVQTETTPEPFITIMFFGLIGMVSLYGGFYGVQISNDILAPLSSLATRLTVTPIKRFQYIGLNALNAIVINFIANAILIAFIQFVLGINVVSHVGYSLLLVFMGNVFGIMLGIAIGLIPGLKIDGKSQILVSFTLILTFIAGGMVPGVKQFVNQVVPWFNELNPINIITENFYRINLFSDTTILSKGILIMAIYIVLLFAFSVHYLRGKRYDNL